MAGYKQFGELPEQVEPQADAAPAGALRQPSPSRLQRLPVALNQDGFCGSGEALWH